jgi:hypothetical protein
VYIILYLYCTFNCIFPSGADDEIYASTILPAGKQGPWIIRYRIYFPKGYSTKKHYSADYLKSLNVPGDLSIGVDQIGGHTIEYWRYHLSSYLEWYSQHLKISH